ncbi:serine hydrolase [Isoptericola sp. 178]|uniref:serine hydrolase domain-containing protein n=1 Tax=Isoptericola sp. 178 TaxID=3064651 RepID=UPI002713EC10|nr:serine hydrolase domain-containing protein [Isoptericola sp. 178]MDO8145600.1 serine hydrolase domain-containing protein [Isoptericola sp. 178]
MTTTHHLLPRATPVSQGVDPESLRRLVAALDQVRDVHSLMVLRHGHVVAEAWWDPFAPGDPHRTFSVSKSVTATAVGMAVHEGLLGTGDRVVDLLPEDAPADPPEHLAAMTVRDLLTMTSGHGTDTMNFTLRNLHRPGSGWARDILASPMVHAPGTRFVYDTGATYLLSAILHRLTGQRLLDWLTPRLFEPLGIAGATWEQSPQGIDVGGYGLAVTTEDLAALGQLWLRRGRWGGRQLVPSSWVDEMTAAQVDNGPDVKPDWEQGYGYQFWRCRHGAYRADGAFGQFVVVWPEHDAVVVLTSGTTETAAELDAIWDTLGRAFDRVPELGSPQPADATSFAPDDLAVLTPSGWEHGVLEDVVRGCWFVLDPEDDAEAAPSDTPLPWHAISVDRVDGDLAFRWVGAPGGAEHTVRCGLGRWVTGRAELDHGERVAVAGAAAWTGGHELTLRMIRCGTPFTLEVRLSFGGDAAGQRVEVAADQPVSFGRTALLRATGVGARREPPPGQV